MDRFTKIVATISDVKCDVEFLKELYDAGMNVVRLNTAHQTLKDSLRVIQNVRMVSEKLPILIDTKGPEIRTMPLAKPMEVNAGDLISIKGTRKKDVQEGVLYVSYPKFAKEVPVGKSILIDDGEIELIVEQVQDDTLVCRVMNKGTIKGKKSVNVPGVEINLPSLSKKDKEYIDFAIENDVDFIAHSFVRNKQDIIDIQNILNDRKSKVKIIAKIENQIGVDNIDEILDHAYGIMVARGDLGIEIPAEKLPAIQIKLIKKCVAKKKPVIIATQMLHSMIKNPRPTRAEISDIATAVFRGTDAIMLSGETAYGAYPLEAIKIMSKVAKEIESSKEMKKAGGELPVDIDRKIAVFIAKSAMRITRNLPTKAVVLDTNTGRTARFMSAFRGPNPVYAICFDKRVMRELALSYGIEAHYLDSTARNGELRKEMFNVLVENNCFESMNDLVVVIGGSLGPKNGATSLEIITVKNILKS